MWEWWRDREKIVDDQNPSLTDMKKDKKLFTPQKYSFIHEVKIPMPTSILKAHPKQQIIEKTTPTPTRTAHRCNYTEQEMYNLIQEKIDEYDLTYTQIKECAYIKENIEHENSFKRIRRDFLKFISYHNIDECIEAGITEEGIVLLKKAIAPENFSVHLKIPYDFGGTNEFENMILVPTNPIHNQLHNIFDFQIYESFVLTYNKLYIPYPKGEVYISGATADIIQGGKEEKQDKPKQSLPMASKLNQQGR